jgi:hypothetical protein
MEKFSKDEIAFLEQFEHNFSCAIDSDYVRGVALSELEKMRTIWERISGIKDFYLNSSCGSCVLTFFKQIGGEYRKQKAEPTPAPAKKASPKKK